jgi:hypothetical protein
MNIYLILSHLFVAIIAFVICCIWHKRKLKTCIENGDYNSSSLISDDATRTLVDNFHSSLNSAFNPIIFPPTTPPLPPVKFTEAALAYVTFADLKKYMCFIENLSSKNGFLNVSNLGIRMYYGRYPYTAAELATYNENHTIDDCVAGHHTLVMVPTFRDGEITTDFNPYHIVKGKPEKMENIRLKRQNLHKETQQAPLVNKMSTAPEVNSIVNVPNTADTNVNLNSFGLTPPSSGNGTGYTKP